LLQRPLTGPGVAFFDRGSFQNADLIRVFEAAPVEELAAWWQFGARGVPLVRRIPAALGRQPNGPHA
jgi:hypothetical protein